MREIIQELFQDYGTLKIIKKIKQPKQKKITLYGYSFDMSYLIEGAENVSLNLLIVDQTDLISLAFFGINKDILDEEHLLEQLNQVNTKMLYGKFLVDEDNDVYWEYSFEPSKADKEYIMSVMKGFVGGLVTLLDWKGKDVDE